MDSSRTTQFPPLLTAAEIATRVESMAKEISESYGPGPITIFSLLKGAFVFTSDLVRALAKYNHRIQIEFITASSYGASTVSSGEVRIHWHGELPNANDRVLIIDDILDTGLTMTQVKEFMMKQQPSACKVAVLLDKPSRRKAAATADFVGFSIEDHFVVGYGLDFAEKYRELPFLAILPHDLRS